MDLAILKTIFNIVKWSSFLGTVEHLNFDHHEVEEGEGEDDDEEEGRGGPDDGDDGDRFHKTPHEVTELKYFLLIIGCILFCVFILNFLSDLGILI